MMLEEEIQNQQEKALAYKIIGNQLSVNISLEQRSMAKECYDISEHHRQIAEWLKELKKYQAIFEKVGKILADNGYTIDDLDTIFGKVNREASADE